MSDDELHVRTGLEPGDIGRIIELHARGYAEFPGFDIRFEAFVGQTLAEFILESDGNGQIWLAEQRGRLVACTAIVHRADNAAQLRWVVASPGVRGRGIGRLLVEQALSYCRAQNFARVYLHTTDGLEASTALYRSVGFEVIDVRQAELWCGRRPLVTMELRLWSDLDKSQIL